MRYFRFIGDAGLRPKSEHFIVEVEDEEYEKMKLFPYSRQFSGKVIKSNNRSVPAGHEGKFCNPYFEMAQYGWPMFVTERNHEKL